MSSLVFFSFNLIPDSGIGLAFYDFGACHDTNEGLITYLLAAISGIHVALAYCVFDRNEKAEELMSYDMSMQIGNKMPRRALEAPPLCIPWQVTVTVY